MEYLYDLQEDDDEFNFIQADNSKPYRASPIKKLNYSQNNQQLQTEVKQEPLKLEQKQINFVKKKRKDFEISPKVDGFLRVVNHKQPEKKKVQDLTAKYFEQADKIKQLERAAK